MDSKKVDEEPRKTEPRKPLDYWDRQARQLLKLELLRADLKTKDIAARVANTGLGAVGEKALAQRIARGSFTFGFALRVLRAAGVDHLDIRHLPELANGPEGKDDPPSRASARRKDQ